MPRKRVGGWGSTPGAPLKCSSRPPSWILGESGGKGRIQMITEVMQRKKAKKQWEDRIRRTEKRRERGGSEGRR